MREVEVELRSVVVILPNCSIKPTVYGNIADFTFGDEVLDVSFTKPALIKFLAVGAEALRAIEKSYEIEGF